MFARAFQHLTAGGALATAAAMVPIGGTACSHLDLCDCTTYTFAVDARGTKVIPALPPGETSASASAHLNIQSLAYSYSVLVAPSGTIDSVALYQVPSSDPLPASATAVFCAGVAACASPSGTMTIVPPATIATIETSMRGYGTQLVFFTTTAQKSAGGAMRGTMYPTPY